MIVITFIIVKSNFNFINTNCLHSKKCSNFVVLTIYLQLLWILKVLTNVTMTLELTSKKGMTQIWLALLDLGPDPPQTVLSSGIRVYVSYLAGGAEVWLQKAEDLSVAENMAAQIARAQTTTLVRCVCNRILDFFLGCVTILKGLFSADFLSL